MAALATPATDDCPALNLDLYCLGCGYNLRGLAGDPVRCPECFFENPVGDTAPPAAMISETLRQLETAPTLCFAGLAGMIITAATAIGCAVTGNLEGGGTGVLCLGLPSSAFFTLGMARFRETCGGNPAWRAALVRYQLCAAAMFASLLIPIGAAIGGHAFVIGLNRRSIPRELWAAGVSATLAAIAIVLTWRWCVIPLYEAACAGIRPLQREVAFSMVRDYLRRRLIAGERLGFLARMSESR